MERIADCPVCSSTTSTDFLTLKDHFLTREIFTISECKSCGFRYTTPRPESVELGRYYQSEEYISHSDKRKGLLASVYQQVRSYTLKKKALLIEKYSTPGSLLDIGCATGQFIHFMKGRGWKVTGIEPDEKTRSKAISEFGLDVFPEDSLNDFKKTTFSVITMWHVLEHVSDLNGRMKQLHDLLAVNGTLFVAVPNCASGDALEYREFWAGYDVPRHLYHFRRKDMEMLIRKHGFRLEKVLPMKFDSFYVSLLSEKYRNGKMRWLPALLSGLNSNRKAMRTGEYSSLIFVLKKGK
jgi:2-polyprenyl-3-methyl-5-hydroxy-6-metoxy-1,4-benzoquinol methylase